MFITILVPIYNVEKYLERCARSLFEQTYRDIEYIFVDDCTPDNSIEKLKNVIQEYPHRKEHIRIISHEKNRGLAAARNTGVNSCQTEFLMHVDSDDYLEKNAVELLVNKQKATNADIVSGCAFRETKEGQQLIREPDYKDKEEMLLNVLKATLDHVIWRRLIRLSLYKEHQIACEEGVNVGEDMQVLPKLVYYAKKISKIDDVIYHYNCMNEESYMNRKKLQLNPHFVNQDLRTIEIVEDFFKDKGDQYKATIQQSKAAVIGFWLTPAYNSRDWKYYNMLANKLLSIDKRYLVSIGWNSFKVRLVNRNYVNRWIYSIIYSFVN
jgi:glycosyltransferase involved in cell wall biosynthesis